jgi:uncharacterized 2Fe-2S/4Fe-4S cluster protein (DUF4445 family)
MKKSKTKKKKKRYSAAPASVKKTKKRYVWLNVLPDDLWVRVRRGKTIWEALQNTDVALEGECGGIGKCGKCKVRVITSVSPASIEEKELLTDNEMKQGIRLACRIQLKKNLVIHVGEPEPEMEYFQILKAGQRPEFYLDPLLKKHLISLPSNSQNGGFSDLDRIKMALGSKYRDLKASLHCLRTLPDKLKETRFRGAAVLHENCLMDWESLDQMGQSYGLVFDLGTSTLVGKLIDLMEGTEVAVVSCLNTQMKYGADVISRLKHIKEDRKNLQHLNGLLVRDLNMITKRLLKAGQLGPEDIFVAVAAGNTTMQHLLLRLNPLGIAEAPFSPVLTDGVVLPAADAGLKLHPEALLYVMPNRSGYIGGDLIGGILASGAADQEDKIILGIDLGTNGEIFLGNRRRLMTCSAAAGPALEGAKISHGMIAKAGAIEGVRFEDDDIRYYTIANIKPKGICGSGLVDLIAVLLHCDIIDHEGLIQSPPPGTKNGLTSRVIDRSGVRDFLIATEEEAYERSFIYLTQKDVREVQLAKGAVAAGIKILMNEMRIGIEDIHQVYLAGALGNYVNPYSAVRVGLIPDFDPEIVSSLGNAASTGASMVLLSQRYWRMANELAEFVEHVELSSRLDFNQHFVEQMDFPRENIW